MSIFMSKLFLLIRSFLKLAEGYVKALEKSTFQFLAMSVLGRPLWNALARHAPRNGSCLSSRS